MKGVFGLSSHTDLFKKLEWEFDQCVAKPDDAYLAYNFFVKEYSNREKHGYSLESDVLLLERMVFPLENRFPA